METKSQNIKILNEISIEQKSTASLAAWPFPLLPANLQATVVASFTLFQDSQNEIQSKTQPSPDPSSSTDLPRQNIKTCSETTVYISQTEDPNIKQK